MAALTPIALTDDPQQAIDKINAHTHEGVGAQVTTAGIADLAVTAVKIANSTITGAKVASKTIAAANIADKTITAAQIADGVIQTDLSQTVLSRKNFVALGGAMKFAHDQGTLAMKVTAGECNISGKYHKLTATGSVTLPARKACLITAAKNTSAATVPTLGYVAAVQPTGDTNTVLRYLFNESAGNPQDTSANLNHITTAVSMSIVDGWFDRARSINGTDGYMTSGSNTNFPTGNAERQIDCIFTVNKLDGGTREIWGYGSGAASQYCGLQVKGSRLWTWHYSNDQDTGIDLEVGKTYYVTYCYDGNGNGMGKITVFINGRPIMTFGGMTLRTGTALVLWLGRVGYSASQYGCFTYHYFEMRNKVLDYWTIAQRSNKALFPCFYTSPSGAYPSVTPYGASAHVYTFNETSGTTVADSVTATAINLTATNTTIVPSKIVHGSKARRFDGSATDYITGPASYALTTSHTLIFAGIVDDYSRWQNIIANRTTTTGGAMGVSTSGKMSLLNDATDTHHYSNTNVPLGRPTFLAITIDHDEVKMYVDSPTPDATYNSLNGLNISGAFTTAGQLYLGRRYDTAEMFMGTMEYIAIIPKTLSQGEIEYVYSQLMTTGDRDITTDALAADTISLGFARTDTDGILWADDWSYKYGRDEGMGWNEGNKFIFLGWKEWGQASVETLRWENQLGNSKCRFYPVGSGYYATRYAGLYDGFGEVVPLQPYFNDSVTSYGYIITSHISPDMVEGRFHGTGGVAWDKFAGAWYNPRFIGMYAEVIA